MFIGLSELFDYVIRLIKLKSDRSSLDIVAFHILGDIVKSADFALKHYFMVSLNEAYLENSSRGTPYQKWAKVTNSDFKSIDASLRMLAPIIYRYYSSAVHTESFAGDTTIHSVKTADYWLRNIADNYESCVIDTEQMILEHSELNYNGWLDLESGLFKLYSALGEINPPIVTHVVNIQDRAILNDLQVVGASHVEHMWSSLLLFAEWLRHNCSMDDVTGRVWFESTYILAQRE